MTDNADPEMICGCGSLRKEIEFILQFEYDIERQNMVGKEVF